MRHAIWMGGAVLALALACGGRPPERRVIPEDSVGVSPSDDTDEATDTGSPQPDASSSDDAAVASDDDAAEPDPDGPIFDLGVMPDVEPGADQAGCTKVDFLFVVDNSPSMEDDQANLVANFPAFIDGISGELGDIDYHVGVVTSDAYAANDAQAGLGCNELGALVVSTGGSASSNAICGPYAGGGNFMTPQDDLTQSFACAASVGVAGAQRERPMEAMTRAVGGALAGPGQCNEGFIREDALLVVVIITDEYDGPGDPDGGGNNTSAGDPDSWFQTVVDAKGGVETNVVIVSLIRLWGGPCEPDNEYDDCVNIGTFTDAFTHGLVGGVCDPDYGPIFQEAIGIIDEACTEFEPPA